jgi:hypothetical protein
VTGAKVEKPPQPLMQSQMIQSEFREIKMGLHPGQMLAPKIVVCRTSTYHPGYEAGKK